MEFDEIPIVDFATCGLNSDNVTAIDKKLVGDALYKALATVGFAYIKNTGVTQEQIDEVNFKSRDFFYLDSETKEKYLMKKNYHGYIGNGQERLNPKRPADLKETYDISGPGMLADDAIWPDDVVPEFSATLMHFAEICRMLAMRLLEVVAMGMDIKDRDLFMRSHSSMNSGNNLSSLRILLYRSIPESLEIQPNQIRLGEHTDFGSLTLVFQDQVGGLQIKKNDGMYMDATPIPGTVLVNVGDCFQFWTQGKLKATVIDATCKNYYKSCEKFTPLNYCNFYTKEHRILVTEDEEVKRSERASIAYFAKPNNDTMLDEIEYGPGHHAYHKSKTEKFKSMTAGQYTERKIKETVLA